jgi:hypothetical protein
MIDSQTSQFRVKQKSKSPHKAGILSATKDIGNALSINGRAD